MRSPAAVPAIRLRWIQNALWSAALFLSLLLRPGLPPLRAGDPAFQGQPPQTLTNTNQLRQQADSGRRSLNPIRLEGIVCAANPEKGVLFLQDETGAVRITLNLQGRSLQPGARVRLTGKGVMEGTDLHLGAVPLADADGVHGITERPGSGVVYLKAGRHPIRVVWFNGKGAFGLEVDCEGPDLPRQRIPASALFRTQVDPDSGKISWVPGLDYRYYEGANWSRLPDFSRLTNVKAGTVTNFDLSVISRPENVGLEFTGYWEAPREGLYTFTLSSDDGSQLFIGEAEAQLEVIGSGPPPVARTVVISQALSEVEERRWSEVEGTVTFVTEHPDGYELYELELSSGSGRMRVIVPGDSGDAPLFLLNSQVRAKGICRSTYTSEGQKVAGAIVVAGWKQIEVLQVAAEHWTATPLVPISSLLSANPHGANDAIVRVQGKFRLATPDQPLLVEDQTGQIPVEGIQVPPEADGTGVELLGRLRRVGATAVFQSGSFRKTVQSGGTNPQMLPVLTSAKQVKYLSREEAGRKYPVKLRGVITSTISWFQSFVLQDATDGVFVRGIPEDGGHLRQLGDQFEVEGVTDPSDFAPTVQAERITYLGAARMPEPIRPNRDQLVNGSLDAKYVEVGGIVTAVVPNGVTLLTLAGKYRVELPECRAGDLRPFENALIRIKGCFYASWDGQTKRIKIGQIRIFNASINVDEPAPADLFAAPEKTPEELLNFDATASALKRIKVTGQIVHERTGEYFMMNGTHGLRFFLRAPVLLKLGDRVEVVGFPELGGASPVLHEAIARKTGTAPLPMAKLLREDTLLSADHDAILASLDSQLVGSRTNQTDQVLEMQAGPRTYLARLDTRHGLVQPIPLGSRLRLTGVYAGQGGDRTEGRDIDSFELLLNSPADLQVLAYPSWWTPRRILMMVGALVGILLMAFVWISGLRRQVEHQTKKLKDEIEEHKRTEAELAQRTQALEKEIAERQRAEREVERVHKQLLTASHQAGMAEVATGVLHNVGNVLNSVNVSAGLVTERLRTSRVSGLARLARLLKDQGDRLAQFLTDDSRGRTVPAYLEQLATHLEQERLEVGKELAGLILNVDHIKEIVSMQQSYARVSGVVDTVALADLVEDAIKIHGGAYARHGITLARDYEQLPPVSVDKHKVLQILVNLIHNSKYACDATNLPEKRVTIRIRASGADRAKIEVADTGVGIPAENLTRIFSQGFTTRKGGHGFGLHSAALAANELGGTLTAHSDGPGHGATFALELPRQPPSSDQKKS